MAASAQVDPEEYRRRTEREEHPDDAPHLLGPRAGRGAAPPTNSSSTRPAIRAAARAPAPATSRALPRRDQRAQLRPQLRRHGLDGGRRLHKIGSALGCSSSAGMAESGVCVGGGRSPTLAFWARVGTTQSKRRGWRVTITMARRRKGGSLAPKRCTKNSF
jgi:hypothetical protein